ncbi:glutamyl-tRNA reductase [Shewanella morhuae]|uniref:Glutamyl-tRNA reductase n=1 Tax=Shewanella morhuae TaxID=365591 RepID=A0ABX5HS37_9GAMM|nr:glutamyl-tRNA reductase [Shewanella morhuae]PTA49683.1 glutamyl-tRNA reductase [Shewanella morhuae]
MKSNVVQHQTDINTDITLIDEVVASSQHSLAFYTQAITAIDDYKLKRIFSMQINIYQRILALLTSPQQHMVLSSTAQQTLSARARQTQKHATYTQAQTLLHQEYFYEGVAHLIDIEQGRLTVLKQAVKQAYQPHTAQNLAESAAWLQSSCDEMTSFCRR